MYVNIWIIVPSCFQMPSVNRTPLCITDDVDNCVWSSESFKQTAYDTCGDDIACLYDVVVTGDLAVGESSKATAQESADVNAALSESWNRARSISMCFFLSLERKDFLFIRFSGVAPFLCLLYVS